MTLKRIITKLIHDHYGDEEEPELVDKIIEAHNAVVKSLFEDIYQLMKTYCNYPLQHGDFMDGWQALMQKYLA